MFKLTDKIVFLTGCGSVGPGWGNGKSIATLFARQGAKIFGIDINEAAARETQSIIEGEGGTCAVARGDVTKPSEVDRLVAECMGRFGRIDILVNNVGKSEPATAGEMDVELWDSQLDINLKSAFLCCRAVLPAMRRRGGGRIITISSGVAFKGNPYMAHYVASKGAVVSLTRAMATELGKHGVLVNSVAPGFTLSDGVLRNPVLVEGVKAPSLRGRVLARDMLPGDLIGAVCFFAGPDAAFITGQTLVGDGGAYFH